MKKIFSFLAVAILAAAAQAASVSWSSGTMYVAKDADGTWGTAAADKAKGGLAVAQYLIVDEATYNKYASDAAGMYKDWSTIADSANAKSAKNNSTGGAAANWSDPTDYQKTDGTIYCLALYTHTSADYGDFYIAASTSGFVNDLGEFEGNTGSLASNVGKWTPVPEPCTVALLALGLAAAGLKRKVA